MSDTIINGEHTTAKVMGLTEDDLEDNVIDQIQRMVDHEAFQAPVRVMPDTHVGSGATIGFTIRLDEMEPFRICPNTVGVDLGCGMLAVRMASDDLIAVEDADDSIRDAVPMGRSVHNGADYHMGEDFPWDDCTAKWARTKEAFDLADPAWFDGYGLEAYFKPLCARVEYDPMRAINSMGSLGSGNHFVELGVDETDDSWLILHSGSRGIGKAIADYWQDVAVRNRTNEWIRSQLDDPLAQYLVPDLDDTDLVQWFQGGKGRSYIDSEAIKADVTNNYLIGYLHDKIREAHPDNRTDAETLDYLTGQFAAGYLVDMIFAQTYAWENRCRMVDLATTALDVTIDKRVHSPHNYVDYSDMVLRKGATRAHDGEQFVLPFNMRQGTLICEGRGSDEWNLSAPHGAGRVMSRTQAFNELDLDEFQEQMSDIYSTSVTEDTLDEAPDAYKDASLIQSAIEPTATVVHDIDPVLNIKALE